MSDVLRPARGWGHLAARDQLADRLGLTGCELIRPVYCTGLGLRAGIGGMMASLAERAFYQNKAMQVIYPVNRHIHSVQNKLMM